MDDIEWIRMIQKICEKKGINTAIEGYETYQRRYVSCEELMEEITKEVK